MSVVCTPPSTPAPLQSGGGGCGGDLQTGAAVLWPQVLSVLHVYFGAFSDGVFAVAQSPCPWGISY